MPAGSAHARDRQGNQPIAIPSAQMRVLEAAFMLQPVAEREIHGDMGRKKESQMHEEGRIRRKGRQIEDDRRGPVMDGVVAPGAHARTPEIAEHGKVGREEEDEKQPPAAVRHLVSDERRQEERGIFGLQKPFHSASPAFSYRAQRSGRRSRVSLSASARRHSAIFLWLPEVSTAGISRPSKSWGLV